MGVMMKLKISIILNIAFIIIIIYLLTGKDNEIDKLWEKASYGAAICLSEYMQNGEEYVYTIALSNIGMIGYLLPYVSTSEEEQYIFAEFYNKIINETYNAKLYAKDLKNIFYLFSINDESVYQVIVEFLSTEYISQ